MSTLPISTLLSLPRAGEAQRMELLTAGLGRPIPLGHGLHLSGGNIIAQHEVTSGADKGKTILFVAHAQGEWEGPVLLWVNGRKFDYTDTSKYHFHPGLDGELGIETNPAVRNQKICSLWPADFVDKFTFSQTAYSAFKLDPDPLAPDANFRVVGVFKARRVRIFDSSGTQTGYQYTANNADIWLDLLISGFLKARGTINEALTAAEKARVDFAELVTFRGDCDAATPQSTKRAEAHTAFVNETDLLRALNLLHLLGRSYHLERGGKFTPFMDKARSSVLTLTPAMIAHGTLRFAEKDLLPLANRYLARFRNLESGRGPGTISTAGTAVTGTGTRFKTWFRGDEQLRVDDGAQSGEVRVVDVVSSDTLMTLKTAFSADQTARLYSNPAADFDPKGMKKIEAQALQEEIGRILSEELDLNNQTAERAERVIKYVKRKALDRPRQAALRALPVAGVRDLLPGDVITLPASQDLDPADTKDFEIAEMEIQPEGSADLAAEEYNAALFDDTANMPGNATPTLPGTGIELGNGVSTVLNPQGSVPPVAIASSPLSYGTADDGANSGTAFIRFTWSGFTLKRADQSDLNVAASSALAVPAAPTLSQVAGGALGARTRYARVALVREQMMYAYSDESSFSISANNLLKVTSPAAVDGYDGWVPLFGASTNNEITQSSAPPSAPIAFGTDWTEPSGGGDTVFTNKTTPAVDTTQKAIRVWDLGATVTRHFAATYRVAKSLVEFPEGALAAKTVTATAKQWGDGMVPLNPENAPYTSITTPAIGGSGSGGAGGRLNQ